MHIVGGQPSYKGSCSIHASLWFASKCGSIISRVRSEPTEWRHVASYGCQQRLLINSRRSKCRQTCITGNLTVTSTWCYFTNFFLICDRYQQKLLIVGGKIIYSKKETEFRTTVLIKRIVTQFFGAAVFNKCLKVMTNVYLIILTVTSIIPHSLINSQTRTDMI